MHTGIDIGMGCTFIVTLNDSAEKIKFDYFGTITNSEFNRATHYHLAARHLLYYKRICDYFDSIVGTVVIEHPMGDFGGNRARLGELFGYTLIAMAERFEPCKILLPKAKEIKLNFTGNGNADKDSMIKECKRRGYYPKNEHEADAIAMAFMSLGKNIS